MPSGMCGGPGQADRRADIRHAILRRGHTGHIVRHQARADSSKRGCRHVARHPAARTAKAAAERAIARFRDAAKLDVFVAQPDDREDRAAAIGLGDRIDARLQPRADECFDAGQRTAPETPDRAGK